MPLPENITSPILRDVPSAGRPVDLDLRHLRCPMPVLLTRKRLAVLEPGTLLRVLCTDPLSGIDIPHLVQQSGDQLIDHRIDEGLQIFTIRKA